MTEDEYIQSVTEDVFDAILEEIVGGLRPSALLAIDGVYTVLREELNNDIIGLLVQRGRDTGAITD